MTLPLCSPCLPQNLLDCFDNSQSRFEIEKLNHGAPVSPWARLRACTDFFFPPKFLPEMKETQRGLFMSVFLT